MFCPHNCSGRGVCDRGFCHCQPPWYGLGCTSRAAYKVRTEPTPAHRLRIYMYELPWGVAFQDGYVPGGWPLGWRRGRQPGGGCIAQQSCRTCRCRLRLGA